MVNGCAQVLAQEEGCRGLIAKAAVDTGVAAELSSFLTGITASVDANTKWCRATIVIAHEVRWRWWTQLVVPCACIQLTGTHA